MWYYDSTYLLVILGLLLGLAAQGAVKSAYSRYMGVQTQRGIPASDAVAYMLEMQGNAGVPVECIQGELTDQYDPRANVLRLSRNVYQSSSVAALSIAAHEAGHAMQKYESYPLLALRSMAVPVVNFGSQAAFPIFFLGILASLRPLMMLGIACFALSVLFALITLPVELDASRRGMAMLKESGMMTEEERKGAKKVLTAAAMTYVASALAALLNLARLIMIANGSNRRRR